MVGHEFKYGTSHSSLNRSVFYGDDVAECAAHFVQQFFVQRFEESQIIVGDASSRFGLGTGDGTPCFISDRSYADDSYIFPSFNFRPLPTGISSSGHFQSTNTPRPRG